MSKLTYQQRGNQNTRIPVGQRRTAGGKVLEDNRAAFAAKQLKQGGTAQLAKEEDELVQEKSGTAQRVKDDEEETTQAKFAGQAQPVQREEQPAIKPNNTGLPDKLKNGIESLSGMSMDNVKVHYNSAKPAQLNALAYAQGKDIHVGPGQEQHLPHEAWHVVQQAQGRVRPTMQMKGAAINDDTGLEAEADVMGAKVTSDKVAQRRSIEPDSIDFRQLSMNTSGVVQRTWLGEDFPKTWDVLLDGVQWNMEADGTIWYELKENANPDFTRYAGQAQKRTHEQWDQLEIQLNTLSKAERRIGGYQNQKYESLSTSREKREFDKTGGVEAVLGEARTPVLHKDTDAPVAKTNWVQIDDDLGKIKDDQEHKDGEKSDRANTKFVNMFHLPREDAEVDAIVMMENFRELARPFFASDAFFNQWMRVKKITSLSDLPRTFPPIVYRNNISNKKLAEMLTTILGGEKQVDVDLSSDLFGSLRATDNVKSTENILKEYNNINALRGEAPSRIASMRIYEGPAIRFTIKKG